MIKINLLPEEYKTVDKKGWTIGRPRYVLGFGLCLITVLVGLGTVAFGLFQFRSLSHEKDAVRLEQQVLMVQGKKLDKELEKLREKEALMDVTTTLLGSDLPLLEIFKQLELSLPDGVWLESLEARAGETRFTGFSYNENDVVLFATGLMQSPVISQVGFPNTRRVTVDDESLVEFRLVCSLGSNITKKEAAAP
ncbi:MAG: hypothetical protein CSA35_03685 [Dethiosulfovibrio peptidovorans]|nr:MAG: hypothetical protein CSA35_03685 [Dethiosulfovibrio peptidovorans]